MLLAICTTQVKKRVKKKGGGGGGPNPDPPNTLELKRNASIHSLVPTPVCAI